MSALKEILDKMYVDPELLEQLDDEQKHILFIKMREEQIRRWKLNEEKQEQLERLRPRPRSNAPRIQWLTGRDGEVWVWVMGEHVDDKPIERIIEDEAKKMAREIAENEVLMESLRMEDALTDVSLDEQALKNQLMEMELSSGTNSSSPQNVPNGIASDKDVNREDQRVARPTPTPLQTPYYSGVQYASQQPLSGSPVPQGLPKDRLDAAPARTSLPSNGTANATNGASDALRAAANYDNVDRDRRHSTGTAAPPPVPAKPVHLTRRKPDAEPVLVQSTRSYVPGNKPTPATNGTTRLSAGARPFPVTYSGQSSDEYTEVPSRTKPTTVNDPAPRNGFSQDFAFRYPTPQRAPQNGSVERQRLAGPNSLSSTATDASSAQSSSSDFPPKPITDAKVTRSRVQDLRQKFLPPEEVEKRESKILERIMEERNRLDHEAELEAERERNAWEEQERRAREAEAQIRLIAQKAREQHRKNLRTSTSLLPVLNDPSCTSLKEAIKRLPGPPKPKNRSEIVRWYREIELPAGTGVDARSGRPARWFHGIVSRSQAERLLTNAPPGAFLVRVAEKIWGYVVSYAAGDGSFKHFLVEKIPEGYQFLGTNQIVHRTLNDLIAYHSSAPVTSKGREVLGQPVGQSAEPPDYAELIDLCDSPAGQLTFINHRASETQRAY